MFTSQIFVTENLVSCTCFGSLSEVQLGPGAWGLEVHTGSPQAGGGAAAGRPHTKWYMFPEFKPAG